MQVTIPITEDFPEELKIHLTGNETAEEILAMKVPKGFLVWVIKNRPHLLSRTDVYPKRVKCK